MTNYDHKKLQMARTAIDGLTGESAIERILSFDKLTLREMLFLAYLHGTDTLKKPLGTMGDMHITIRERIDRG